MSQAQRHSNEQNQEKNQNRGQTGGASLQNKSENDDMMSKLKNIDAQLEADGRSESTEGSTQEQSNRAPKESKQTATRGNAKENRKGLATVKSQDASTKDSESKGLGGLNLGQFKSMSLEVNKAVDLAKGYLAKDKTAPFIGKLGSEVGEQVIEYMQDWAGKNNAKIDVDLVGVQEQTPIYTGVGATAGAGIGYFAGGKVGAALGLIFGAALGAAASCVSVKFATQDSGAAEDAPVVH